MAGGDVFDIAVRSVCPHTDCEHLNTYTCSGWVYAADVLNALTDAGYVVVKRALRPNPSP